ncbi:hypothetical protein GCM10022631_31920 [Deinococcus rubellus]
MRPSLLNRRLTDRAGQIGPRVRASSEQRQGVGQAPQAQIEVQPAGQNQHLTAAEPFGQAAHVTANDISNGGQARTASTDEHEGSPASLSSPTALQFTVTVVYR